MATSANIRKFVEVKACAKDDRTYRAYQIVRYGHESTQALLSAFRKWKRPGRGAPTDEEQDLLRAMLVMAGACLDSSIKQLFRDCLPTLIGFSTEVRIGLEKFAERSLKRDSEDGVLDTKILARTLTSVAPLKFLSEAYVDDLTGGSLQSVDELFKASGALGLDPVKELKLDRKQLKDIFEARNRIVHEMDVNFDAPVGNRFKRATDTMTISTNELLTIAQKLVEIVHKALPPKMSS